MIATLERLHSLNRKLKEAIDSTTEGSVVVVLEPNDAKMLKRLTEEYLNEAEAVALEIDSDRGLQLAFIYRSLQAILKRLDNNFPLHSQN